MTKQFVSYYISLTTTTLSLIWNFLSNKNRKMMFIKPEACTLWVNNLYLAIQISKLKN